MLNELALSLRLMPRAFRFYPVVDSTSDLAMQWLHEGAGHGSLVIADEQRRGRGRHGRTWVTPPQSAIALSLILRVSPERAMLTSMIGALSVMTLCEQLGIAEAGIKWPNDVLIDGRKVCGILPEAVWQQDQLLGVILGIGVNVSVVFDGDLRTVAVSLEDIVQVPLHRVDLVVMLVEALEKWNADDSDLILQAWRARLTTIGQQVRIADITGLAIATDDSGALLVQTDTGRIERVVAGDLLIL